MIHLTESKLLPFLMGNDATAGLSIMSIFVQK